jgi:hypothetical protein
MLNVAFSSEDDEALADAVTIWIVGGGQTPPGFFACYLAERVGSYRPFSPRLRRVGIHVIERIRYGVLEVSGLETVRLLNRLNVDVDDMVDRHVWA